MPPDVVQNVVRGLMLVPRRFDTEAEARLFRDTARIRAYALMHPARIYERRGGRVKSSAAWDAPG